MEPISVVTGSLPSIEPLVMENVTQLHVTDEVINGHTANLSGESEFFVSFHYLDVSKPKRDHKTLQILSPSKVWIVAKLFVDMVRPVSKELQDETLKRRIDDINKGLNN